MIRTLLQEESGFILSGEFLVIMTVVFCGVVVGFVSIRDSLVGELHDVSEAIGSVSQSYNVGGIRKARDNGNYHAKCSGFGFNDDADDCDCSGISFPTVTGKNDPSNLNSPEGI